MINQFREANAERSEPDWQTSNAEYRMGISSAFDIGRWTFGVGRFPLPFPQSLL